jgi:hypothetical protein
VFHVEHFHNTIRDSLFFPFAIERFPMFHVEHLRHFRCAKKVWLFLSRVFHVEHYEELRQSLKFFGGVFHVEHSAAALKYGIEFTG